MYIKDVTASDIGQALQDVANLGETHDHNLTTKRLDPTAHGVNVTLRVSDSKGVYAKRGYSGRRTVAACYHGHFEFMAALFRNRPAAKNLGSMMHPVAYGDMCDCEQD